MLERSMQAAFLVPMAVSLAFGVLFATFITLFLVPISYIILDDVRQIPKRLFGQGAPAPGPVPDYKVATSGAAIARTSEA